MPEPTLNYHRRGVGEPLLLIHGIGSRWQVWLPVLDELARSRDVIAIDLPGFGFSARPGAGAPAGAEPLATLVSEFLDAIGVARPHIGGNSLGGWVALELARRDRAASVTALSPAGFHGRADGLFLDWSLRWTRFLCRTLRPDAAAVLAPPARRRLLFAQLAVHGDRMSVYDAAENVRGVADATWFDETRAALVAGRFAGGGGVEVPVTIAWGRHDYLLLRRQAHRASTAIPHARMVTLHGCGHVPTYDDPAQVAAVLLEGSSRGA
jgi:pimeloyl-ACP methyl ester carboxylesterase